MVTTSLISRLSHTVDQSDTYEMNELEDDYDREKVGGEQPSLGGFDVSATPMP